MIQKQAYVDAIGNAIMLTAIGVLLAIAMILFMRGRREEARTESLPIIE